ncbi:AN1-type zinc finger protein 2A isoform X1 [Lingula anatina]|uniref:AN1-type zinc finger protein 2A isoform X1 n=1 Tax=Lingula anatina TaxID=7574 RepID=A0A1S3IZT3_LINAN|nr:AN1-type zinc finger protein 2A isoform X1 [Lingula anatina]|eukprot:XP_013403511.1 AN1-type zinc finger protein 2A isoform X1 [Lingula anatina]
MELPHLGQQCSESFCKQLDFLPLKCDACQKIFCKDHFQYQHHNCPESFKKDNQVPVCPLCNKPIPVDRGELPDIKVGQHIDTDCQSDPAKARRGQVYQNRCSKKGCKTRELVPVVCEKCHKNFCFKHRHESDHKCQGFEGTGRGMSRAGAAAMARNTTSSSQSSKPGGNKSTSNSRPQQSLLSNMGRDLDRERRERAAQGQGATSAQAVQGAMSEDEALARAIALSMADSQQQPPPPQNQHMTQQEQEDLALAQAIAASEQDARRQNRRTQDSSNKSSCSLS